MRVYSIILSVFLSFFAINACLAKENIKLIFSLDQGFGNGVVANCDRLAVTRICDSLSPLRKHYDVYLLINPHSADKEKLNTILNLLVAQSVPFVFDVISSDTHQLSIASSTNAYDSLHGISISLEDLKSYKLRYGKWLAGIRFMEVFAHDFSVQCMKTTNPEWKRPELKLPEDDFYKPDAAEQFIKFAHENDMFVQWSDFHWSEFAAWDEKQIERERSLVNFVRKYRNTVIVTYANNEPNQESAKRLSYWWKSVDKFARNGAAGYGLSNQSWMKGDVSCPVQDIINWTKSALKQKCRILQFEPVWYLFNLPRGSFDLIYYKSDPQWEQRGIPTDNYRQLEEVLLKRAY